AVRDAVAEKAEPVIEAGKEMAAQATERVSETAQQWQEQGTRTLHDWRDAAAQSAHEWSDRASRAANSSMNLGKEIDAKHRDTVLFSVAGLAVAAAAVIAYHKQTEGSSRHA